MPNFKSLTGLIITACFLVLPLTSFADFAVNCDNSFVKAHPTQLIINVSPTGTDDTENIQCALDEAKLKGVPIVRLAKGDFAISYIFIENFKGSFQGTTRADTRLEIMDNSVFCSMIESESRISAAIKFDGGEPKLKFMTISSGEPCSDTQTMRTIVHFTGADRSDASCSNDVIFALVDRVDMIGPGDHRESTQAAILASPEGLFNSSNCKRTLLGSFKVNQSNVTGYGTGVNTSMRASAQVDINFNSFTNNRMGVNVIDANQSTTITGNSFTSENNDESLTGMGAIRVQRRNSSAPDKNRMVIHNNRFMYTDLEVVAGNTLRGSVFAINFIGGVQDLSLSVTDNHFQVTGAHTWILNISEIDDWVVSGNLFTGRPATGIVAVNYIVPSISGGVIVANSFKNLNSNFNDIYLGPNTTKCIVGSGQDAAINDNGTNNTVL